ncbi:28 kDa heat- and acid-stable phosphoprotein-like [Gigaspora margarita]|uniref:28 kDa heat- and acid-stable phosphoprotein-like n=1 Tax=Gigaspora margarita TaxID=4874 RepID=A0A8H3XCM6_GIGMA|nr:28 kDa heat- and acid-stable phosphoprotein-like [Gigaspora margarita]
MPQPRHHNRHSKPTRGGGRKFTNPRRLALAKDAEEDETWGYREGQNDIESSDEEEEREDVRKSKESKELKSKNSGSRNDGEEDEEDEDDTDDPISDIIGSENPNRAKKDNLRASEISNTPREMTRREREAAEKEAAKQRYWKLHLEGKTEQAKSDLARLAIIKKQREEAAIQRKAEAEAKAEALKAKLEKEGRKSRNKSK